MSYECDLFFIFIIIFIYINQMISRIQTHCSFAYCFGYGLLILDYNMDEECE